MLIIIVISALVIGLWLSGYITAKNVYDEESVGFIIFSAILVTFGWWLFLIAYLIYQLVRIIKNKE